MSARIRIAIAGAALLAACSSGGPRQPPPQLRYPVSVSWEPVSTTLEGEPVTVTGYRLIYGRPGDAMGVKLDVDAATTQATVRVPAGLWQFNVVAISADAVSEPSNTIEKATP